MTRALSRTLRWSLLLTAAAGCGAHLHEGDLAGIERLHAQDVAATAPGDPRLLEALWTDDAVRITPGGSIDVGRAAIHAADTRAMARHPEGRVVTYVPVIEDVRITGDWAFEWGKFTASFQDSPAGPLTAVRGTVLRVLRRQSDGAWKFARVMVHVEEPPRSPAP
jgi:uncharacterized protein (TIGR02246 family)